MTRPLALLLAVSTLWAESAKEKDLQAKLAAADRLRVSAERDRSISEASRIAALTSLRQLAAAETARRKLAREAAYDAANLQFTAQYYAEIARQAVEQNKRDLADAVAKVESARAVSEKGSTTATVTLYTVYGGFAFSLLTTWLKRRWALADANRVLAAVKAGADTANEALIHSNHQTDKIVAMREDLVSAVKATNSALDKKADL